MNLKLTLSFLPPVALMLLLVACGGGAAAPSVDIEATVEARVELAKAAPTIPAPAPTRKPDLSTAVGCQHKWDRKLMETLS